MHNSDKWPLWVRIYARDEERKLFWQLAGILLGILALAFIEYLLDERNPDFLSIEQLFKYLILMLVFSAHVILISKSNNWVLKNSTFDSNKGQTLNKIYSYILAILMIVLFVVVKDLILR